MYNTRRDKSVHCYTVKCILKDEIIILCYFRELFRWLILNWNYLEILLCSRVQYRPRNVALMPVVMTTVVLKRCFDLNLLNLKPPKNVYIIIL